MAQSNKLLRFLVSPSKLATALDWKRASGTVLSLDIHKDRIGMAIASHPAFEEEAHTLAPIRLSSRGRVPDVGKEQLLKLVTEYRVCGIVVSWPVQQDTGRMGAPCGRVIHTLEDLIEDADSNTIITSKRPLVLWDGVHATQEKEDEWGRCTAYSRTSTKRIHRASEEQYYQDENIVAAQVWDDFVHAHWPTIFEQQALYTKNSTLATNVDDEDDRSSLLDGKWEDSSSYVKAALL